MKDGFNREINYLRLAVTNRCSYKCIYCNTCDNDNLIDMPMNRIVEYGKCAASLGLGKIRLTGGEPTIRKDICDIIYNLKNIDGIDEVYMTTNGFNLSEISNDLFNSGLDGINVSIDSLNEKKYKIITKRNMPPNIMNTIIDSKFKIKKINVVLMKDINTDEIKSFVNHTKNNEIDIRFIEFMPVGYASELYDKYFISNEEILKQIPELEFVENKGVSSVYKINGYRGNIGLINPISNRFCEDCNKIRITADEKIIPCLHSNLEIDISKLTGMELKNEIIKSISLKPQSSHLYEIGKFDFQKRNMQNIGG